MCKLISLNQFLFMVKVGAIRVFYVAFAVALFFVVMHGIFFSVHYYFNEAREQTRLVSWYPFENYVGVGLCVGLVVYFLFLIGEDKKLDSR